MSKRPFSEVLKGLGFFQTVGQYAPLNYNEGHGIIAVWDEKGECWWMPLDQFQYIADRAVDIFKDYGVQHCSHAEVPWLAA